MLYAYVNFLYSKFRISSTIKGSHKLSKIHDTKFKNKANSKS